MSLSRQVALRIRPPRAGEQPCLACSGERTVVLAIPLLFEAEMTDLVSEVWVVSCPLAVQVARLMGRDRISEEAAKTRIASQMPLAEKVALADVVLDNGTSPENLFQQVDSVLLNGQ